MKMRKQIVALLCLLALVLPVAATEAATENTESPTLAPLVVGVRPLAEIPESWSPLAECGPEQKAILELTGEPLYRTHNGAVILLHSTSQTNADILEELIGLWKEKGYRFAPISELFSGAEVQSSMG